MIIIIPETTDTNSERAGFHFNTEDEFFNYLYYTTPVFGFFVSHCKTVFFV
jgi:hypothetical protein